MMLVSYRLRDSDAAWHVGMMRDQAVVDASAYVLSDGRSYASVQELLPLLDELCVWASQQFERGNRVLSLETLELGPPVPNPDKILCLGVNYREHAAEAQQEIPVVPLVFAKFRNSLTGPTSPILLPRVSKLIDYEGELAVIIGKRCKAVTEQEALGYVAGYSIINDVTARDIQAQTSQWTAGKALDTFAPMGPGIVPASQIPDPQTLTLITRVNGQEVQHDRTANMLFPVASALAFLSSLMTLEPGDILATGTPSGVGFKRTPPLFLQDGDVVEVEIERIGRLRNPVKRGEQ
jgi:2-keto-4-pentenoate hydratase/2-oxohepta-3-ene-1,7-dioic acid hydratase in catechol pathway